ncbi:PadR family transcriptional regulator [Paenibacillus marchantiophytorum]|uniref:PadR family transcriptional regulator n=1 Tax=Paenibacillus marchantiophytorum TaxID=1619310 RepID=A0ABQ1FJA2_9BACL|nr:PadR family transcriptional regulator [Paenibacillus marchantiophytorum]GGA13168.1 PadR family transcriptional regulator [Paenibacillus marchantiophytorum]
MNSQDVILGMLMKRSLSGYEIKQLFESLFSYFYNSSYGTIYPMLHRLEKEELITKENVLQEGKPNKNVYTITDKGKSQFTDYLLSPVESDSVKSDFLMRLYFGQHVGYEKVLSWLTKEQVHAQKQFDDLTEKYALYHDQMHPAQIICIQIGIKEYQAKLEVIREGMVSIQQCQQEERD